MIDKEILKEIVEDQRKEIIKEKKYIKREKLKEIKQSSFALIISGIRRSGKSVLLKQLAEENKEFYYLNLEDQRLDGFEFKDFNRVDEIFKELFGKKKMYFFDEIQNIKGWEKFIRYLIDNNKRVIITGSNASMLSRELGTHLTGRHLRKELFPFSFKEFLKLKKLKPSLKSYNKYFTLGGFPEYLKEKNQEILQELLNDVVMRDVAVRFKIKNTSLLKKMAIYLITNIGKEFSYNSLRKMLEISSVQTVIDFSSFFEDAYLIFTIPKFSYSYKKQLVNPKKVYSIDNGFSRANSVSFSKDKGKMLENQVFLNLRKKYKEIFYFQNKNECDFIVKEKEKIKEVFQVCYELSEENKNREINGLLEAMAEFKLKQGTILTYNKEDILEIQNKKIIIKPVWKWLLEDGL